jgi:hypothetical protein
VVYQRRHVDDPEEWTAPFDWFGAGVIALVLAVFCTIGMFMSMSHHHQVMVLDLLGFWTPVRSPAGTAASPPAVSQFRIVEETRHIVHAPGFEEDKPTGDLLVSGELAGQAVNGKLSISVWPWSNAASATLGGQKWKFALSGGVLTLTDGQGHKLAFARISW